MPYATYPYRGTNFLSVRWGYLFYMDSELCGPDAWDWLIGKPAEKVQVFD